MTSREQETSAQDPSTNAAIARQARIAALNDRLRQTYIGGRVMQTCGIARLSPETQVRMHHAIQTFDAFDDENDPYSEHDMAGLTIDGHRIFWKIDYYAPDLQHGSSDPASPAVTTRVLTIMLAEEY